MGNCKHGCARTISLAKLKHIINYNLVIYLVNLNFSKKKIFFEIFIPILFKNRLTTKRSNNNGSKYYFCIFRS